MDSQELNRACELAFQVAREGVEQDPPIDPPAPMRMFLYVRQYPQRALTVARQVLTEDEDFRARVAAVATEETVGAPAMAWLTGEDADHGDLSDPGDSSVESIGDDPAGDVAIEDDVSEGSDALDADDAPVTKESIRSEMDELKSLVGQLSDERAAVGSEVQGLAGRLEESEQSSGLSGALSAAVSGGAGAVAAAGSSTSSSLTAQIRSLHADLKQARSERDHAQEAKELAILEHAELAEELESLRSLAGSAKVQLTDLEARVDAVSNEKAQLEAEKAELAADRESLSSDRDSLSAEVEAASAKLTESEDKLAAAESNLAQLTAELESARGQAGVSVDELQAAVAARTAMESHVDALGGAHAKAQAEMERVNAALADRTASDRQKIETLKVALASVTAERDALQTKLESVRATVSSLQGEMAKLDADMTDAESVASVLSERMEELQSSVEVLPADDEIAGDLTQFETPDKPVIDDYVAPAAFVAAPDAEPESIDVVAEDVSEVVSGFEPEDPAEPVGEAGNDLEPASEEEVAIEDEIHEADVDSLDDDATESTDADHEVTDADDSDPVEVDEPVVEVDAAEADADGADATSDQIAEEQVAEAEVDEVPAEAEVSGWADPADEATESALETVVDDPGVDDNVTELVPDEMIDATDFINNLEEVEALNASAADVAPDVTEAVDAAEVTPLVMSDTTDESELIHDEADLGEPGFEDVSIEAAPVDVQDEPAEDLDEVHALVSETVASFEPDETDTLPGAEMVVDEAAETVADTAQGAQDRAGLTSLFSTPVAEADLPLDAGNADAKSEGLLATAGVAAAASAAVASPQVASRGPIAVPAEIATDSIATAQHIVNTENAVLLVDGDPVAAMGWPSVDRVGQRRNLVHYLSVMAGASGAAPDVLLDRDFGVDRLPDSRSVRVRVTNEEGSVSAQIVNLIDTYPTEWPVVVVTDNMDLAAEAAMKGATLLDNGQLLDLFMVI